MGQLITKGNLVNNFTLVPVNVKKYTSMPRNLIEHEGTATVIVSFLPTRKKVWLQGLNKRLYNIISPKVIFIVALSSLRLSAPYW